MMSELVMRKCTPCKPDTPPLSGAALIELADEIPLWSIVECSRIRRDFRFPDFAAALAFVNRVGDIAEAEGHHPDIAFTWGKASLEIWTHSIGGLSESDFILAAKIDQLV